MAARSFVFILCLSGILLFAGCEAIGDSADQIIPSIVEAVEEAGPPPLETPTNYVALASYILNLGLGAWAIYERRRATAATKNLKA